MNDRQFLFEGRVVDPQVQTPPAQGVAEVAGPVARQDHVRDVARPDRPDLRDAHLEVGEDLQEERLELLIGAVHLVDQQHGCPVGGNGLEQGPLQHKRLAEDQVLLLLRRQA